MIKVWRMKVLCRRKELSSPGSSSVSIQGSQAPGPWRRIMRNPFSLGKGHCS